MNRGTMVVLSRLKHRDYYHLLSVANQLRTQGKVPGETSEEKLEEATLRAAWSKLKADQDLHNFSFEDKKKAVAFVYHNLRFLQSNTRRIYSKRDMKAVKEQKRTALIKTFTKSEYVPEQQDMVKKVPSTRETRSRQTSDTANAGKGRSLETPPPGSTTQAPVPRDAHAASLTLPENRGTGTLGSKGLGGSQWHTGAANTDAVNTGKGGGLGTPSPDATSKKAPISRDAHAASLTLPENRGNGTLGSKGLRGSLWAA